MPRNAGLIDFKLESCRDVQGRPARNDNWGIPEVAIYLTGGANGVYDTYHRDNGTRYVWMTVSKELVQNLHRACGEFLAKEAHDAVER